MKIQKKANEFLAIFSPQFYFSLKFGPALLELRSNFHFTEVLMTVQRALQWEITPEGFEFVCVKGLVL